MPVSERAKQFSPFAALRGLDAAMERKRREVLPEEQRELTEYEAEGLADVFSHLHKGSAVSVTYLNEGKRVTISGSWTPSDPAARVLCVAGKDIPLSTVLHLVMDENQ